MTKHDEGLDAVRDWLIANDSPDFISVEHYEQQAREIIAPYLAELAAEREKVERLEARISGLARSGLEVATQAEANLARALKAEAALAAEREACAKVAIETAPQSGLWWREDFAQALAKLDGVTLQDVRSTVGPAGDANSWRIYLGKADDLMAALIATRARTGGRDE